MQTSLVTLLIALVASIVALLGLVVYVFTKKHHAKHPTRIGRYKILKELPSGGMSRIFFGKRPDGKYIIIKIPVESKPREEILKKFLDEGSILSRLKHPHIVGLEEYNRTTINGLQTGFVALEYVEGHSLDKYIKGGRKFSADEASLIISSVTHALSKAHKLGIYHRDISTSNILVNYEGKKIKGIKLIDFGIAKWAAGGEYTTKDMMKEHYASPEQINREQLDGRSDIYSLGIVYTELLTGKKPFSTWERNEKPVSPVQLGLPIPEHINNLIMKMLEKDKNNRVPNVMDIIQINKVSPLGGQIYIAASRTGSRRVMGSDQPPRGLRNAVAGTAFTAVILIVGAAGILLYTGNAGEWLLSNGVIGTINERDSSKPIDGNTLSEPLGAVSILEHDEGLLDISKKTQSSEVANPVGVSKKKKPLIDAFCPYDGERLVGDGFRYCPTTGKELPRRFWGNKQ